MLKYDLIPVQPADYPIIENLWYYYVYDLSRYCGSLAGWQSPTELCFTTDELAKYFTTHMFLIKIGKECAGFVFLNKSDDAPKVDWYMSEFFIISKFQKSGIGQLVAKQIFEKFPGQWSIGVLPENSPALHFWRKVINSFTQGNFQEEHKTSDQLKTKDHPNPYPMIMLRFHSS